MESDTLVVTRLMADAKASDAGDHRVLTQEVELERVKVLRPALVDLLCLFLLRRRTKLLRGTMLVWHLSMRTRTTS